MVGHPRKDIENDKLKLLTRDVTNLCCFQRAGGAREWKPCQRFFRALRIRHKAHQCPLNGNLRQQSVPGMGRKL